MRLTLLAVLAASTACANLVEQLRPESDKHAEREIRADVTAALDGCAKGKFDNYRFNIDEASRRMPTVLDERYPFGRAEGTAGETVREAVIRCDRLFSEAEQKEESRRQATYAAHEAAYQKLVASVSGERRSILQLRGFPHSWTQGQPIAAADFWVFMIAGDGTRPPCSITYLFKGDAVSRTEAEPASCAAIGQ